MRDPARACELGSFAKSVKSIEYKDSILQANQ
jgi:hypothetical protein